MSLYQHLEGTTALESTWEKCNSFTCSSFLKKVIKVDRQPMGDSSTAGLETINDRSSPVALRSSGVLHFHRPRTGLATTVLGCSQHGHEQSCVGTSYCTV